MFSCNLRFALLSLIFFWLQIVVGGQTTTRSYAEITGDSNPTELRPLQNITQVSADGHSCAITREGGVKCWGHNTDGDLGDGTYTTRFTAVDVINLNSTEIVEVSAGLGNTCALTSEGGVKCWGDNLYGQLGDGSYVSKSPFPVDVVGLNSGVVSISVAGYDHACALTSAGGVKCWGNNRDGQLGDGTTERQSTPVDVTGLNSGVTAISAGRSYTCALTSEGRVKCWGNNRDGQLGDGTTERRSTPVDVIGLNSGVVAISAGRSAHTCALTSAGAVKCWGSNTFGQLGDGTTVSRYTPVDVISLGSDVTTISAGGRHTCALMTTGGVKCWGSNYFGQLGDGTTEPRLISVDVVGLSSRVIDISAGGTHTCAVINTGGVKCWGQDWFGQLGDGPGEIDSAIPVDVVGANADSYSISGNVTDKEGRPVRDVTISLGFWGSTTTDVNGEYTIDGLEPKVYTVTPVLPNYEFSPSFRNIIIPPNATDQNFVRSGKPAVVFVHGWNGFPPQFTGCDQFYKSLRTNNDFTDRYFGLIDDYFELDYEVFYAHFISSPCWTPEISENLQYLIEAINTAKRETGRSKVILIAHSMGGIISRAYLEGPDYRDRQDVEALFTFGSFHQGVPVEKMVRGLLGPKWSKLGLGFYCDNYQPAVCNFKDEDMTDFNESHPVRAPNVIYHVISGDAPLLTRSALGIVMAGLIPGGDDGIVPSESGTNLQRIPTESSSRVDHITTDEAHHPVFGANSYFTRTNTTGSQSYFDCLYPVLISKSKQNCGDISVAQSKEIDAISLNVSTPTNYEVLSTNQPVTYSVHLEGGKAIFAAQWSTSTIKFSLVAPNNQIIDSAYAIAHPNIVTNVNDLNASVYYLDNAMAGAWKMVVQATSTVPAEGIPVSAFAAFDSRLQLTTGVNKKWYLPGETATITAAITQPHQEADITATVVDVNNVSTVIKLTLQSDDIYKGDYVVANTSGYADVRIAAYGTTSEGMLFERADMLSFQISPQSAQLTGSYDEIPQFRPSNLSFYDSLDIAVGVHVTRVGRFGIAADLYDLSGHFIAHSSLIQNLNTQASSITLRFNGSDIYQSMENGPYLLTNLVFTDQQEVTLILAEESNIYQTLPYSYYFFGDGKIYLPVVQR